MRIVHISDIHWRGIARHNEYIDSFERLFAQLQDLKPDAIVNTGDTFHTKTQGITPEVIERLSWMFRSLANIAPSYTILGNHDGNLTNLSRQDMITPIHESIAHSNAKLLRKSGVYSLGGQGFYFCVFSPFDQKNWDKVRPVKPSADGYSDHDQQQQQRIVNIALYHGSISGCEADNNWRMKNTEAAIEEFQNFDFVLLGDIHKQQWVARRFDKEGALKPWMAYPGSLIQQNHGESETKGYLVWDIHSPDDWNVEFHELPNKQPFVTVDWKGDVDSTIRSIENERKERAFLEGTRFRVASSQAIPSLERRKITHELKEKRKASEVSFKYDLVSKMEHVSSNSVKISKKGLRKDPDAVVRLYMDYIAAHKDNYDFSKEQLNEAENLIRNYMNRVMLKEAERTAENTTWSLRSIDFDNIFRFGEGNSINFDDLEGIVGIFGNNKIGKSSIVGALMYTLYNTTDRGPVKNAHIINKKKDYCRGSVCLDIGGTDYLVERQSKRNIPKKASSKKKVDTDKTTTTLNLSKIEDGDMENKVAMNSITRDDTDKEIRKLIGTSNDFLLTALSSQGGVDRFIKEGPTERKKILGRFLELDIFENLYNLCKENYSELNTKSSMLSPDSASKQIKKTRKEIEDLEERLKNMDERLEQHRNKKDEVNLWLMHHEHQAAEVDLSQVEQTEKQIADLEQQLQDKEKELKTARNTIEADNKKLNNTKKSKSRIDIDDVSSQLEHYEALKTTLQELKNELNNQEQVLETQKKNVRNLELVPCGDQYPNCMFIRDGHRDKNKIDQQKELVERLTKQYESTERTLEEYVKKKLKEKKERWEELDRIEFELSQTLNSDRRNRDYLKSEIKSLKADIKESRQQLDKLKKRVDVLKGKEYLDKKQQISNIQQKIDSLETQRHEVLVELGGKKEALNKLLKDEEESRSIIEKLKIYESILNAFSKNGIPAMVLKSQLPSINLELEKILEGIVDFNVRLETDINSNVMDILIEDHHSTRIAETASGMEKTICSMALRVALINLSSLPKPDIFVIDEGFGALDEDNVQSCMEMLNFLRGYFKTVLVISHVPTVKEVADKIIEVKNDGSNSKVEV